MHCLVDDIISKQYGARLEKVYYLPTGTVEPLKCPSQGPGTSEDKSEAYRSFLANVEQFQAIGTLPTNIYFENESPANFYHTVHLGIKVAT